MAGRPRRPSCSDLRTPLFMYIWLLGVTPLVGIALLSGGKIFGLGLLMVSPVLAWGYWILSRAAATCGERRLC